MAPRGRRTDRRTHGQDHVLSQADALTRNRWHSLSLKFLYPLHLFFSEYSGAGLKYYWIRNNNFNCSLSLPCILLLKFHISLSLSFSAYPAQEIKYLLCKQLVTGLGLKIRSVLNKWLNTCQDLLVSILSYYGGHYTTQYRITIKLTFTQFCQAQPQL